MNVQDKSLQEKGLKAGNIGLRLGELFRQEAVLENHLKDATFLMNAQEIAITPPQGWTGSNDKQRDTARSLALYGDENYQKTAGEYSTTENALRMVRAEIKALETERRALEVEIEIHMARIRRTFPRYGR